MPQISLAALLGSLLPDADSWLYLLGPEMYGRYHRVFTHCIVGGAAVALVAGVIAWLVTARASWRRFGWFVADNLPQADTEPPRASLRLLIAVAALAVVAHILFDVITGYGNILPFWPWSPWDASLRLVNSFDWVIFSATLAWHVASRRSSAQWGRPLVGCWATVVLVYLAMRWLYFPPSVF